MNVSLFPSTSLTWLLSLTLIASSLPCFATAADTEEVRVMSFNVRYGSAADGENHWDKRKDFLADTVIAFNPDLLGTQETLDFQKSFLESRMPQYTGVGVGRDDGSEKGEMTALFFKTDRFELLAEGHFWLSETPDVAGSKSWDSSLPRIASWVKLKDRKSTSMRPIFFLNTHFDHRGKQARQESARLILKQVKELGAGCDVVISGDFNAAVQSGPYRVLFGGHDSEAGQTRLIDTYAVAGQPDPRGETTFTGFHADRFEGARIDWIAVSKNWEIKAAAIDRTAKDGRTPSDHYPVTTTIMQTAP